MDKLIKELIQTGYLKTPRIIEAFYKIDRKNFVPSELENEAYGNYPLSIGEGQTISQPLTVAFMLELLAPEEGDNILEIGAGSGWQTALLAELVGNKGKIIAVERIEELVDMATKNLASYQYPQIKLILGDGSLGYNEEAPYDKIIAAASALETPLAWEDQLKEDGKIVLPIKQSIWRITKKGEEFKGEEFPGFVFVPLIEKK